MNDEEFGTTAEYLRAFETLCAEGVADNHLALLRAHYSAPDHTATWAQLAAVVGYANGNAVNLHYGTFASRVASAMGITSVPNGFWLDVLAGWAEERDAVSGHTSFIMRRPVIEALARLGIVADHGWVRIPEELDSTRSFQEGARLQVLVNAYERNPEARRQCIKAHGTACCICGFIFGAVYGPEAEGYIHIHHIKPLSEIGGEYVVDPV